jgi:predicted helicase
MQLNLKPTHAKVKDYYNALNLFGQLNISHETAVRQAFASLLDTCAKQFKWKLVQEFRLPVPPNKSVIVDGAVLDSFTLKHGFWEAKDLKDELEKEVKKKLEQGYPRNNIIFQSPERAILYQGGLRLGMNEDITTPDNLVDLLKTFFAYREPHQEEWETAVAEFSSRIPEIARAVKGIIDKERTKNQKFIAAFESFVQLCRQAINPNLSDETVETMLIQHLLTERIFRRVFNNPEFTRRNIIAAEIEKVIDSLTSRHFSRDTFLRDLDRFYHAIEINAENATDYSEKQSFLNTVYERFFHGFSPKEADTRGVVYTPQPVVDFMVRSVEETLKKEFGKSLSDKDIHILDPFVGTGNFIVRIMQEIKKTELPFKYDNELHCNEIMLLPYYIASMNIENAFLSATGEYKPFEGICLVDTFELAEATQSSMFTAENTARVERQKRSPIFVIIGNPPYNTAQQNEMDLNKNRRYPVMDRKVRETYAKDSNATLLNKLSDPYVKAIKWATDRIGAEGIVALITNNSFLDQLAFDGVRKHLAQDFSTIYHVDLKGNARTAGERRRREGGNVFDDQIRVSVGISLFVKKAQSSGGFKLFVYSVKDYLTGEAKRDLISAAGSLAGIQFTKLTPDSNSTWLTANIRKEFEDFTSMGTQISKDEDEPTGVIFGLFSNGVLTARDAWAYNFSQKALEANIKSLVKTYTSCADATKRLKPDDSVTDFAVKNFPSIKWTRRLLRAAAKGTSLAFNAEEIRDSLYRPFTREKLYFSKILNEEIYSLKHLFPQQTSKNLAIVVTGTGFRTQPAALMVDCIPNYCVCASTDSFQSFPFYSYSLDGTVRRENITDWAIDQFRSHYKDSSIDKWDVFYYSYAVLHHPEYRTRYATNLKHELPRIPYALDFHAFAKAGKRLAQLHVDYEKQKEYPLERKEKPGEKLDLSIEKMRLSKDKTSIMYNDFLTLNGIPKETFEYRLGNRAALEWVIDQYQVSTDKRSGITNDPNRDDDPEYVLRLIGQVITVSVETVKLISALPDLGLPKN